MEKPVLLSIKGLQIEGRSGDAWHAIVKGVDLTLHRGEVLGLIGEYIGRMFLTVNQRPQSVVREVVRGGGKVGVLDR